MVGTWRDKIQQLRETITLAEQAVATFGPGTPYVKSLTADIEKLFAECFALTSH